MRRPGSTLYRTGGALVGSLALAVAIGWGPSCSKKAISSEGDRAQREKSHAPAPGAGGSSGGGGRAVAAPARSAPQHSVFSLLDNRLLAHLVRDGGLFIPAGHPGMAKYVTFMRPWSTWKLGAREDGRAVALAARNVTWLRFPLTEAQAKATTLTLSVKSPSAQGLSVKVNQAKLKPVRLASGWQKVDLSIPSGALWSGENRVEISWGATGRMGGQKVSGAVEWLHLGPRALAEAGPLGPAEGHKLLLPASGGLAYYVHPYKGAKLRVKMQAQPAGARCDLRVRLLSQGQKPVETVRNEVARSGGQEVETVVDLAAISERVGRMEILAEGGGCKSLLVSEAAIVMPGPEPRLKRTKAPKNVLFWMIDNARADRYTVYNPKTRVTTPVISQLAETGTLFTRAYVQGTESRVSHASIWTGAYPKQHNFIAPEAKLALAWVTLPEAVQKAGLYTAAWISNGFVSKRWGFGEGWNIFHNYLHEKAEVVRPSPLSAEGLANFAIRFLEKPAAKDRRFIYVGTIDPHVSWRGRQPWLREYDPLPYRGTFEKDVLGPIWEKVATGARSTTPEDKRRILAVYDSTVSYNDHHLGRLLTALKDKGLREDTMIVITADHGEELWDYGKVGHGCSVKQEIVAVPLIIHYPPLFGRGVRVRQGVDVLSVMPTILDALGATIPDTVQGESLLPLAQGIGTGYPRPSIGSQYELAHAIRLERWKIWVGGKGEPQLYDLESKQGEHREVGVNHPNEMRWLTDALSTFLVYQDKWRSTRWGVASNHTAALAEDLETGGGLGPIRVGRRGE